MIAAIPILIYIAFKLFMFFIYEPFIRPRLGCHELFANSKGEWVECILDPGHDGPHKPWGHLV